MKERGEIQELIQRQNKAAEKKRFLTKVSLAAIGLGLVISAIGFSIRDGVWEKERQIRDAYPQNQELWRPLEQQQHLPQRELNSNAIVLAGFAVMVSGFGINITLATKKESKNN